MKHAMIAGLCLAGWLGLGAGFAQAQFGTLGQSPTKPRPTVSPFINQGSGGNISAFQYYGIIRPQTDANRQINELQQRLNPDGSLRPGTLANEPASPLGGLQTGHPATFFNYGHYFPMTPPMGGSGGITPGFGLGGVSSGPGVSPFAGPGNRMFYGPNMSNLFIR